MNLVEEGGFSAMVPKLIEKYGVAPRKFIPEGAFKSESIEGFDIQLFDYAKIEEIRSQIAAILAAKKLITFKDLPEGVKLEDLLKDFDSKIDDVLDSHFSLPDSREFKFMGEVYTPESFTQKHFNEILDSDYVQVTIPTSRSANLTSASKKLASKDGQDFLEYTVIQKQKTLEEVNEIIRKSIDEGKPVQGSFFFPDDKDFPGIVIDKKNGKIIGNSNLGESPRFMAARNSLASGHAVLIVGYELDKSGNIVTYKILNSWGKNSGDGGIYHMNKEFFNYMLKYIDVNEKTGLGYWGIKSPWKLQGV